MKTITLIEALYELSRDLTAQHEDVTIDALADGLERVGHGDAAHQIREGIRDAAKLRTAA